MLDSESSPRTRSVAAALFLLAFGAACSRDATTPTQPAGVARLASSSQHVEQAPLARFEVTIAANGTLRPHEPIVVNVRVKALLPTSRTVLRVVAPEVELSERQGWSDDFDLNVGEPIRPVLTTSPKSMEQGSSFEEAVTLRIARAGYYRVVARASSLDEQPLSENGLWVRNVEVAEVWLLVTEGGGILTSKFAPERVPADYDRQPGPFRRQRGRPLGSAEPEAELRRQPGPSADEGIEAHTLAMGSAAMTGHVELRAVYYHDDLSAYVPLEGAHFTLRGCTLEEWQFVCESESWVDISSGYTDAAGKYYLSDCTNGPTEYATEIRTYAGSSNFHVLGGLAQRSGPVASDCGTSLDLIMQSDESQVFANLRKVHQASATLFGTSRPFIEIEIDSCGSGTSYYSPSQDRIVICDDSVWELWGVFIAGHEYGHAFHEVALYGNEGGCSGIHFLDTESSLTCAFSEGFADFYGVATRPDLGQYVYRSQCEDNYYFPGCAAKASTPPYSCTGGTSEEGALIEGAFAAFLLDLVDTEVEAHDSVAAPGAYLRDLIRTCEVQYSSGWRRANGPDEIAYCSENAINPSGYFTPRGVYPSAYAESATESGGWTQGRVRANWIWNLYEKP